MKREEFSNLILESFQEYWNELSWEKKRHFSYRAALISDDVFWRDQLLLTILNTRKKYNEMIGYSKKDIASYLEANPYIFSDKLNDQLKRKPIEKYPEIKYWDDLLTHIVLGESSYYRNRNIKTWAGNLLVEGFLNVVSNFSIDLASELGLCLKLCMLDNFVDYEVLEDRIYQEFDSDKR